jgi:DNA/RNA endonuclease YhcR with UshA esterase domain
VAVIGNVTVPPNVFNATLSGVVNSEIWIQDETGGLAVFPVLATTDLALGDRVQVVGLMSQNGQALQIGSTANRPEVTKLTGNTIVAPRPNTVLQARARTDEGRLVTVSNLTIASVPTGTGAAFTVIATSSADDTLQIRVSSGTGITRAAFTVGNRYDITGILSSFNGVAQLKPRFASDIVLGQAITSIATARGIDSSSTQTITVVGTVTVPPGRITTSTGFVNSEMWIQDATGGIAVFPVPTSDSATIRMGDVVEVTGRVKLNAQQEQIGNFNFVPTVTRLRAGTPVTPIVLTGAQARSLTDEGELITIQQFTVTAVGGGTGVNFNVDGTAADGSVIQLRINGSGTGVEGTGLTRANFTVGNTYSVTGILSVFNATVQIKPRQRSDIIP